MTDEELKKKIVDILVNCKSDECAIEYCSECDGNPCIENCREKQQADALITAGIGDVGETKEKLKKINERILLGDIIACDLSAKCAEYKHRAEVAERALMTVCTNVVKDEEDDVTIEPCARVLYKAYLKQAEKELAEEGKDD